MWSDEAIRFAKRTQTNTPIRQARGKGPMVHQHLNPEALKPARGAAARYSSSSMPVRHAPFHRTMGNPAHGWACLHRTQAISCAAVSLEARGYLKESSPPAGWKKMLAVPPGEVGVRGRGGAAAGLGGLNPDNRPTDRQKSKSGWDGYSATILRWKFKYMQFFGNFDPCLVISKKKNGQFVPKLKPKT